MPVMAWTTAKAWSLGRYSARWSPRARSQLECCSRPGCPCSCGCLPLSNRQSPHPCHHPFLSCASCPCGGGRLMDRSTADHVPETRAPMWAKMWCSMDVPCLLPMSAADELTFADCRNILADRLTKPACIIVLRCFAATPALEQLPAISPLQNE